MSSSAITGRSLLQYGFIALPVAFAGFPLYILAPDFYVTEHGLSLALLGSLLFIIRLFDAVQDPFIGWLTDRLHGRFPILMSVAAVVLGMSIYGLFNLNFFSPAIWFALCMVFAVSAYSVLTIVLGAQATLWSSDSIEQTRIAGVREAFGLIGLVVAVSMPTLLSQFVNASDIYYWYALILGVFLVVGTISFSCIATSSRSAAGTMEEMVVKQAISPLSAVRALPTESLRLFSVYGVSMFASSIPAVLVIFYVRDLLGVEKLTGLFLFLYFVSGAVAMPLWKNVSARLGKYKAWGIANVLAVVGFIYAFFLGEGDVWPYAAVCVISGVALGADLTLPPSILADQIHKYGNKHYSGSHYALLAFIGKASLALASAIALPTLDMVDFKPQSTNSIVALTTLSITYALTPCALKLLAAGLLYRFFIRGRPGGNHENLQCHGNHRSSHHV